MRMLRRHGQHVVLNLLLLMKDVSLPALSLYGGGGGGLGYFIALETLQCWKQSKALLMSRRTAVNCFLPTARRSDR